MQSRRQAALGQHAPEFSFNGGLHQHALRSCERQPVQYQALDVKIDIHAALLSGSCHTKSSLLIGRLSFWNSARAASSNSGIVTAVPACAARKAALIAT